MSLHSPKPVDQTQSKKSLKETPLILKRPLYNHYIKFVIRRPSLIDVPPPWQSLQNCSNWQEGAKSLNLFKFFAWLTTGYALFNGKFKVKIDLQHNDPERGFWQRGWELKARYESLDGRDSSIAHFGEEW